MKGSKKKSELYSRLSSSRYSINLASSNSNSTTSTPINMQRTGRWNQDEHILFMKGCIMYDNSWGKVTNSNYIA